MTNLKGIISALGASGMIGTAGGAAMLLGSIYLIDCRITARSEEGVRACYSQAALLMTTGAGVGAGYVAGYNTLNPALKREEDKPKTGIFGIGGTRS
jgi:hypothetical protein